MTLIFCRPALISQMGNFIKNLQRYGTMPEEVEVALEKKIQYKKNKKGDFLYKAGQTSGALFILNSGSLKNYYSIKDKVFNSWFLFENIFFSPANSLYTAKPTFENSEFLEDSETEFINSADLELLAETYPVINLILRKIVEEYCVILEERLFLHQKLSAKEKYDALLAEYPDVVQRVSLGNIASYLGITSETLSRLRGIR